MDKGDGSAESWLATFTQQLRTQLPQGQFILSHAREYITIFVSIMNERRVDSIDSGRAMVRNHFMSNRSSCSCPDFQVYREQPLCCRCLPQG